MAKNKEHMSRISVLHYFKLLFRSALLIAATVLYVVARVNGVKSPFATMASRPVLLVIIWAVFVFEMALRFFPSRLESMGCQKQFKRNYRPTGEETPRLQSAKTTFLVAAVWLLLNGAIAALYYTHLIDAGILILISLFYSVCDMICILFFCPFQTWFMKNKCCGSCRIYNWDYAMMFTPLAFIVDFYTWSLLGIALLLLLVWELSLRLHPERFSEATNECLSCANCKEKLCHHKRQLRHFLRTHKEILLLKGNTMVEKAKKRREK